jgi:hypothetical protein
MFELLKGSLNKPLTSQKVTQRQALYVLQTRLWDLGLRAARPGSTGSVYVTAVLTYRVIIKEMMVYDMLFLRSS